MYLVETTRVCHTVSDPQQLSSQQQQPNLSYVASLLQMTSYWSLQHSKSTDQCEVTSTGDATLLARLRSGHSSYLWAYKHLIDSSVNLNCPEHRILFNTGLNSFLCQLSQCSWASWLHWQGAHSDALVHMLSTAAVEQTAQHQCNFRYEN